ncbi:MAG: sensor histidine kinase [Gemmatimonadota bacterium]
MSRRQGARAPTRVPNYRGQVLLKTTSVARRALALDLRWKILIANAALIAAAAFAGLVAGGEAAATPSRILLIVALGVLVSLPVNALLIITALRPLRGLEEAAARVAGGDLSARAPASPLADATLGRLVGTFNHMLDHVELLEEGLRRLAQRVTDRAEEERQTLALRLRDDTAQELAVALLGLRRAGTVADATERERELANVRHSVATAINGSQTLAEKLRPPGLDALGLKGALAALARRVERDSKVTVRVRVADHAPVPQRAQLTLYRAGEEALANAVRHADPSEIVLSLSESDEHLVLEVVDDGVGFEPDPGRGRGLGLLWMEQRARALGGTSTIDSAPGRGTRVRVSVPCAEGGE